MLLAFALVQAPSTAAQILDEVRIYIQDPSNGGANSVLRFNRKLQMVGITSTEGQGGVLASVCPMAVDGLGRSWIVFDPLNTTKLLRIDNQGGLLSSAMLGANPVNVVIDIDGCAYATSRVGLTAPGPAHGFRPDGSLRWSNSEGPSHYNFGYPQQLALTASSELWIGDATILPPAGKTVPYLVRLDTTDGHVIDTLALPGSSTSHTGVTGLAPAGDATLWAYTHGGAYRWVTKLQGTIVLQSFPVDGGYTNASHHFHVDAHDRPYVVSLANEAGGLGTRLLRYDPASPTFPDAVFQCGGIITGWAFGVSGEDAFVILGPLEAPLTRRLERMNLVSGVRSSIPLDPVWLDGELAYGDVTGFNYANVTDREGDNDGDGAANREETLAGSNPFNSSSRPNGPKVYLSFALSNGAPILKYVDPDGILNPTGGLKLTTLSLVSSKHGEIFQYLLSFLTFVQVSPDNTEVTALFGALSIAPNSKWQFEAKVEDKSGATGWDWQVTRPGDL